MGIKVDFPKVDVRITIPNLVVDQTIIQREAYMAKMVYDRDAEQVRVEWIVQHFSDKDGSKGEYLGSTIPDYLRPAIAGNNVMCDALTGYPIDPTPDSELGHEYDSFIGEYVGQFDFFIYIAETMPIVVNTYLRTFGELITDWSRK